MPDAFGILFHLSVVTLDAVEYVSASSSPIGLPTTMFADGFVGLDTLFQVVPVALLILVQMCAISEVPAEITDI